MIGLLLKQYLEKAENDGVISAPVRIVDSDGNILDIIKVEWSLLNGGAHHIVVEAPDE